MLRKLFFFTLYICILCCSKTLFAQTLSDKVDSYVQKAMAERHIPGLSLAVIMDGVPVKVKGYGMSNLEHKIPVNPETIFQSGSIAKQFTATAILQLKEEGKLKLDDNISKYFAATPASWQNITIRNLLFSPLLVFVPRACCMAITNNSLSTPNYAKRITYLSYKNKSLPHLIIPNISRPRF